MMIAESLAGQSLPRTRRGGERLASPSGPRGFVFAVAALPGEAEGFRWPSWLSPVAGTFHPGLPHPSSSKRSR